MNDQQQPLDIDIEYPLDIRGAVFSDDEVYRYSLWRRWGRGDSAVFMLLNPSTADARVDDPTIRRCINFAKREGCSGVHILNIFALRSTDPKLLYSHGDPEGPGNPLAWIRASNYGGPYIAAWGSHEPKLRRRGIESKAAYSISIAGWKCLGTNKDGSPRHPLYLPNDQPLEDFKP